MNSNRDCSVTQRADLIDTKGQPSACELSKEISEDTPAHMFKPLPGCGYEERGGLPQHVPNQSWDPTVSSHQYPPKPPPINTVMIPPPSSRERFDSQ